MIGIAIYYMYLLNNFCISCVDERLTDWSDHPWPSHCWTPGIPWMSLPGPSDMMTHPDRMKSHQCVNPYSSTLHWGSPALHWAETGLHWLLSWRVHLQHYQTWSILCTHLTTQVNETKLRRDLTWLENSIALDTWSQTYEYTSAFTIVLLRSSLDLRLVHFVLSRYFTTSLYCEVHYLLFLDFHLRTDGRKVRSSTWVCSSVSPCLDLTSSDWHWSGLLDLPRHSLPRRSRFQLHSRFVTCRPLRFLRICIMELLDRKHVTVGTFRRSANLHLFLRMSFQLPWTTPDWCHHWTTRHYPKLDNVVFFDSESLSLFRLWRLQVHSALNL